MMYYFTESKWYGPIENGIDFNNDDEAKEYYLSLPSGPSTIPQFAGMVKEEGKDFVFDLDAGCSRHTYLHPDEPCDGVKKAIPMKPEYLLSKYERMDIDKIAKELSKESTAPDKETPDWMISDIRRGLIHGILYERQQTTPVVEEINPETGKPFFDGLDEKLLCKPFTVAEEKLSWQEEVIAREEEGDKGNRELAVDFAWENSYRLNSLDGYQSFVKIFNDWYSKNSYHKKKAEEGKQTFSEDKLVRQLESICEAVDHLFEMKRQKATRSPMQNAWNIVAGRLYDSKKHLTEYLKTKQ